MNDPLIDKTGRPMPRLRADATALFRRHVGEMSLNQWMRVVPEASDPYRKSWIVRPLIILGILLFLFGLTGLIATTVQGRFQLITLSFLNSGLLFVFLGFTKRIEIAPDVDSRFFIAVFRRAGHCPSCGYPLDYSDSHEEHSVRGTRCPECGGVW